MSLSKDAAGRKAYWLETSRLYEARARSHTREYTTASGALEKAHALADAQFNLSMSEMAWKHHNYWSEAVTRLTDLLL